MKDGICGANMRALASLDILSPLLLRRRLPNEVTRLEPPTVGTGQTITGLPRDVKIEVDDSNSCFLLCG